MKPEPEELAKQLFRAAREERVRTAVRQGVRQTVIEHHRAVRAGGWQPARGMFGIAALIAASAAVFAIAVAVPGSPVGDLAIEREPTPALRGGERNRSARIDATAASASGPPGPTARGPMVREPTGTRAQSAPRAPSLSAEIQLLESARQELAAGSADRALALLDRYTRQLGGTQLRAEAELLRIEALDLRGDRALAAELARRFVDARQTSPLVDRARAFTGDNSAVDGGVRADEETKGAEP